MDYAIGHIVQYNLQKRYFMGTLNYNYNLSNAVKIHRQNRVKRNIMYS